MTNPFRKDDWRFLLYGIPILAGGLIIGYFLIPHPTRFDEVHLGNTEYRLINPLLSCGDISVVAPKDVDTAQDQVQSYITSAKQTGRADDIAVYFRDLNNGSSWGIGSDETFSPGSLLKVPLLMSALTEKEAHPAFFFNTIEYHTDPSALPEEIPAAHPLKNGERYTVEALLTDMITESSNSSADLIYTALGPVKVNKTYQDLDLDPPVVGQDYTITVKQYAGFFLYLYNSSYLAYPDSEQALELLSRTSYKNALVAGVPDGTIVAHKFGERELGTVIQLHDCGIVYAPGQPYLICVMTRGADLKSLSGVIQRISNIVYTNIAKN